MLSLVVHFKNKYPGSRIDHSEDHVTVYDQDGNLVVAVKRGGGGQLVDQSATLGAVDKYDLSPLPKNARIHKLSADGKICKDDKASERAPVAQWLADKYGKVPCIETLKKAGFDFDGDSVVLPVEKVSKG